MSVSIYSSGCTHAADPKGPNSGFGLKYGPSGLRRGLKRRGTPTGSILVEFQLKWSHGDLLRDPNHGVARPVFGQCTQVVDFDIQVVEVTGCSLRVTEQSWRQSLVSNVGRFMGNRIRSDLLGEKRFGSRPKIA